MVNEEAPDFKSAKNVLFCSDDEAAIVNALENIYQFLMENNVFSLMEYYSYSIIGISEHSLFKMQYPHMEEY
jgi:hypothetical protein